MWQSKTGKLLPRRSFREEGHIVEKLFFESMRFFRGEYPDWLIWVEESSRHLDRFGHVDAVVLVYGGQLYLQIKSSEREHANFRKEHPEIPCLLVRIGDRREHIYNNAIKLLEGEYRRFCANHPQIRRQTPQERPSAFI